MELLTSAKAIRDAIKQVCPTKVAVAYIGKDWQRFVDVSTLTDVIVSPTLGSNPFAIAALMKCNGVNVQFLDHLHSKIYIGQDSVLVGSCNLSTNALGEGGLHEVAMRSTQREHRRDLLKTFDQYLKEAATAYPDENAKRLQLERLREAHKRAQEAKLLRPNRGGKFTSKARDLEAYRWNSDERIHIGWWSEESSDGVDRERIRKAVPEAKGRDLDEFLNCWIDFQNDDDIRVGDWILTWRCDQNGAPRKNAQFGWMRADAVVPNASGDKDYPMSVIEIAEPATGELPFKLNPKVNQLLRELILEPRFKALRPTSVKDAEWTVPPETVTRKFLTTLKNRYGEAIGAA